jgi:hypothetical protein
MLQECGEKHSPARCEVLKEGLTPQQRLAKIEGRELCYRHLEGRDCWTLGRVPNCCVNGCRAPNNPILHGAIVAGLVMIIQGTGEEQAQTHLCREDVWVEVVGKTTPLHALYDWGASNTLITHATVEEAGLEWVKQSTTAVAGLDGKCVDISFHYIVPIVDGNDKVGVVKAMGVGSIAPRPCPPRRGSHRQRAGETSW